MRVLDLGDPVIDLGDQVLALLALTECGGDHLDLLVPGRGESVGAFGDGDSRGDGGELVVGVFVAGVADVEDEVRVQCGDLLEVELLAVDDLRGLVVGRLGPRAEAVATEAQPVDGTDGLDAQLSGDLGIAPAQGDDLLRLYLDLDLAELGVDGDREGVGGGGVGGGR